MNELDLMEAMSAIPNASAYSLYVHPSQMLTAQQVARAFPEVDVFAASWFTVGRWALVRRYFAGKMSETDK